MMELSREEEFLGWFGRAVSALGVLEGLSASSVSSACLTAMREAGGVDYRQAEAQTVAFQVEFESADAARAWSRERFASLAAAFEEAFGPQAMVFTSIFEKLEWKCD